MARRRSKKRTHVGSKNPGPTAEGNGRRAAADPKSMVIRVGAGEVGSSLSQLAADVRRVMEPGTASRLKERRANRLRDYVSMCGPLGVTHLLLFSKSDSGNPNLRIALAPRGPTLHFRIERYSLGKDIRNTQKRPKGSGREYHAPPLLVMNNFTTPTSDAKSKIPRHLESLTTTVFQSLFPAINPQHTPLKSIKRVLLVNREISSSDTDSFVLNFRHYAITTKKAGTISRAAKRLDAAERMLNAKSSRKGALPNLSRLQDIADFMMDEDGRSGYTTDATSGSEMDTDNEVEVLRDAPAKVTSAKARATGAQDDENGQPAPDQEDGVERLAVKLVDLGPRMRLRLTKVEEGLCSGKVMWHEYLHKSKDEVRALDQKWEQRRKEKEARRKLQKENIEKKRKNRAPASTKDGEEDVLEDGEDWLEEEDLFSEMDGDDFDSEGLAGDADEAAHVDGKAEA